MSEALNVQIDPGKFNYFSRIKKSLEKSCSEATFEFDEGDEYVNLNCFVETKPQLEKLWKALKVELKDESFAASAIVTCTDEGSWANYLLLYHRDPKEDVDKL